MRILMTGATGFLGRRVVAELAPRHELRLLLRPTARRAGFPGGVELVEGDVTDRASVERAAAGCDFLLHAAALVKILAPAREFDRVNLGGLDNVLAAASAAGVPRALYVSSFIALGPTEHGPGGRLDERAEPRDRVWINDYERTKTLADRRARRAIDEGVALSVVYPGVIYGPGELTEGNLVVRHILDLAHGRLPALLGRPERRWNYVFVEDVARGIATVVDSGRQGRFVLGGENLTLAEFYATLGRLSGLRIPDRRMPDLLAKAAGGAMKTWARLTGGVPSLTPDLVEIYRHDWALDSTTAERQLGYRPLPWAEGLTRTLAWLKETPEWPR